MKRRLSLDLGSNSIGWVLFDIDEDDWPTNVVDGGCRIFSNSRVAKTNVPKGVERRIARGARRRRDRFLQRKRGLVNLLVNRGYIPAESSPEFAKLDPYLLRHEALTRELSKAELGRVLLHLVQRRGFLSNRKDLSKAEGGKTFGEMISNLEGAIEASGAKTLGSFLYLEYRKHGKPTRMRADTEWYPKRAMYEQEFAAIKATQAKYHPSLSAEDWGTIHRRIFFQRDMKKPVPGNCLFEQDKPRCYSALPSYQRFRMSQQLANLKFFAPGEDPKPIDVKQRETLEGKLLAKSKVKYDEARKLLGLPADHLFNLEAGNNSFKAGKHLLGDSTAEKLRSKKHFGPKWLDLPLETMDKIVTMLIDEDDQEVVSKQLAELAPWLTEDQLEAICALSEDDFERGYGRFCLYVVQALSEYLRLNFGATYDEAVQAMGYHHSDFRPDVLLSKLPYYGEIPAIGTVKTAESNGANETTQDNISPEEKKYGKIPNPTVHAALNQLRKVVNAIISLHGSFDEVIIEVARDLPLGERGLKELSSEIKANEKNNDRWADKLKEHGLPNTYNNRLRLRLWEELSEDNLGRVCPYSGEVISINRLFSEAVEVDHILPKSRTFTNHHSNLIVCTRKANQAKGDRSPYEAFSGPSSPYSYDDIINRIATLPPGKQRKFAPSAMEEIGTEDNFLERQLNDTRYISKVAAQYVRSICERVRVSRGKLTAFLRSEVAVPRDLLGQGGKKNRDDHRHHTLDAFMIGLTAPKTLKRTLRESRTGGSDLPQLVSKFAKILDTIIVSHRPNHSPSSRFFGETNYGRANGDDPSILHSRKGVAGLSAKERTGIVDEGIRDFVAAYIDKSGEDIANMVFERFGAKKVKVISKDASAREIRHPGAIGRHSRFVSPEGINRIEAWRMPGSGQELKFVAYSEYEAAAKNFMSKKPHPAAKKLLTIHKGDYLRLVQGDKLRTVVVESLRPSNEVLLFTDHNVGKNPDFKGRTISFGGFVKHKVRTVHVDELGKVKDPGPWWLRDTASR